MWLIYFKIEALFGHFRNPYTTIYKQTYPFPPKPTIVGIISAMCGWDEERTLSNINLFKIGIPEWKKSEKIIEYAYILAYKDTRPKLRPERFEILVRPSYEVILASQNKKVIDEVAGRIQIREFEFPIYMGKNEFLINKIELLKKPWEEELKNINKPRGIVTFQENRIPPFSLPAGVEMRPPQVFIGVPLELERERKEHRRVLKKVYGALATEGVIKLDKPTQGFKRLCEVSVI